MTTKEDLVAALYAGDHLGAARGITARHLCARLDVPPRRVRQLVSEARLDAVAICGTPREGYFIAQTDDELLATLEFLVGRAKHSLLLASRLSRRPLAELAGQLLIHA